MQFTYLNIHKRGSLNISLGKNSVVSMSSVVQCLAEIGIKNNQLNEKIIIGQATHALFQRENEDRSMGL